MTLHIECLYCPSFDIFEVNVSNKTDWETLWCSKEDLGNLIKMFRAGEDLLTLGGVEIKVDELSRLRVAEYLEMKLEDVKPPPERSSRRRE